MLQINSVFNVDRDKTYLKVISTNCDSLMNKRDELLVLIAQYEPKIIILSEILPKNIHLPLDKCEFVLPDYEVFISSLETGRGVAIYVHESLPALLIETFSFISFQESVWCCAKLNNFDKLLIGSIYRSPNSSAENNGKLNSLLKSVVHAGYSHILISGDFNYKEIDWCTLELSTSIEHEASIFLENIRDCYLIQHITQPTRFRENQQESCLDLIFTNEEMMVDSLEYLPSLGASDHLVLMFNYVCYIPPDSAGPPKYNFFKGDYVAMREALGDMVWEFNMCNSTDDIWISLVEYLNTLISNFVPLSLRSYSYRKPWMNSITAEVIDRKRRAWTKLKNCTNDCNVSSYKKSRNEATSSIRQAKHNYEYNICSKVKEEPKLFWSYVKSKCKTRDKVCDLMKDDGTLTNSGKEKAEILNNFFVSVFTQENLSHIPTLPDRVFESELSHFYISPDEVLKKLKALKASKSSGPDGLHCKLLIELKDFLCEPLACIFNKSLETGEVPVQWRRAHVSPIFNKRAMRP